MSVIINKTYHRWYDENGNEIRDYFGTSADQVIAEDGNTLEEKVGDINGITDSLTSTDSKIAASAKGLKTVNDKLANCWISFTDKDGNPTTEPYIHWLAEE